MSTPKASRFILGLAIGLAAGHPLVVATIAGASGLGQIMLSLLGDGNRIEPGYVHLLMDFSPYLLCLAFFSYFMRKTGDRFVPGVLLGLPIPGLIVLVMSSF